MNEKEISKFLLEMETYCTKDANQCKDCKLNKLDFCRIIFPLGNRERNFLRFMAGKLQDKNG